MQLKYKYDCGDRCKYFKCTCQLKKHATGDCVVRALSIATNIDYKKVLNELFDIGREIGHVPNQPITYEKWLEQNGWIKMKPMRKSNNRKYRVAVLPVNLNESYIVHTSKHLTAVVDGVLRDTWDCRDWCANSYYIKGR